MDNRSRVAGARRISRRVTERDTVRLRGLHPRLVALITEILQEMDGPLGAPMFVVEGLRTIERQVLLYAQGRTTPGQIVTYKDGMTHRSNHQAQSDGFGHAVDVAFIGPQPFDRRHPWQTYGEAVEARGLKWGGRWAMSDLPHAELPMRPDGERLI